MKKSVITLFAVLLTALTASGEDISLPDETGISAQASIGEGSGLLTVSNGEIQLHATMTTAGTYSDNKIHSGTILDYRLPEPVAIPAQANNLSLEYRTPSKENGGMPWVALKLLIVDRRGGVWALGTTLSGQRSQLLKRVAYAPVQSYDFDTSESGRLDPWVMTSLDPEKFGAYDPPQPPFQFAGFRLILEGKTGQSCGISLRGLKANEAANPPVPYWALVEEFPWHLRQIPMPSLDSLGNGSEYGNYGLGTDAPRPFLRAADLHLSPGSYQVNWEILDASQWTVLGSGSRKCTLADPDDRLAEFPLLPVGTYHLRVAVRGEQEHAFHDYFMTYVVIRSSNPSGGTTADSSKPLQIKGDGGPVFDPGKPAEITVESGLPEADGNATHIEWRVESNDLRVLAIGKEKEGSPAHIDLGKWAGQESTLWVTAWLKAGDQEEDVIHRTVGFASPPEEPAASGGSEPNAKLQALSGQIMRTKCDWFEGATPIATQSEAILKTTAPWMDEAVQTGYDCVEVNATWWDLNPLPGVYQFKYLDRLVALAKERHLLVTLRINPSIYETPLWVPREFMENQDGLAHGLWSGASRLSSTPSSKPYREALFTYLQSLSSHYRNEPAVLGYCFNSLTADHDWLDIPFENQNVDYSEATRLGLIEFLKGRYGDGIDALSKAYGDNYGGWDDVKIPRPVFAVDSDGRLKPRSDARWRDWMDYKVQDIADFRLNAMAAVRKGDPGCWAATYESNTSGLYMDRIVAQHDSMATGSMEEQFPKDKGLVPFRLEPIAKIARTAPVADVGVTNMLLSAPPGYNAINNYWMVEWRLATLEKTDREAEDRLHQWFGIMDRLVGARFADNEKNAIKDGAYLTSFSTQLLLLQNTFMPRSEDYLRPFAYRSNADKVRVKHVGFVDGDKLPPASYPYIYVPYGTAVLSQSAVDALVAYVEGGGHVIVEATSGYWSEDGQSNFLGKALGIPPAKPLKEEAGKDSEETVPSDGWPLGKCPLAFRISPFQPPINNQPTPWIQCINGAFLKPYRLEAAPGASASVVATFHDGSPAALLLKRGQGQILALVGVADWLGCPGLAEAIDAWGKDAPDQAAPMEPTLVAKTLIKGNEGFVVGRRFIGQDALQQLVVGKESASDQKLIPVTFASLPDSSATYHVRELLGGADLGVISGDSLLKAGVSLNLTPGEGFVLEATPNH